MTVKELAFDAQQRIQASTGVLFKRTHIYELLAAYFGFRSYAAFSGDHVLTERRWSDQSVIPQSELIKRRCVQLEYRDDTPALAAAALESLLAERQIGIIRIPSLIDRLGGDLEELWDRAGEKSFETILLDALEAAAKKGNASAHYALALVYSPGEDIDQEVGSAYWYTQAQRGIVLKGVEKEWAEVHKAHLARTEKYTFHIKEAGRLGHQEALLELADQFDDPSFFNLPRHDINADPIEIADIAERLGRTADAKRWLTRAAESGDTSAMLELIEEHDREDLLRCWTWIYLSQLLGTDLTQDDHYAINEDGSEHDDDAGGPLYLAGRDGVDLEPLSAEDAATAKLAAKNLFKKLKSQR